MRRQFMAFLAAFFLISIAASAQTVPQPEKKPVETIWLNEVAHNFGKIAQGIPVTTFFEIKTTNSDSLKLQNVQASCGCTTPEFKVGTYAPGETVKIKVGYNAGGVGNFVKAVTITYNNGLQKVIHISGEVQAKAVEPAPTNETVERAKD